MMERQVVGGGVGQERVGWVGARVLLLCVCECCCCVYVRVWVWGVGCGVGGMP